MEGAGVGQINKTVEMSRPKICLVRSVRFERIIGRRRSPTRNVASRVTLPKGGLKDRWRALRSRRKDGDD
jgi:hypothetical protein